MIVAFTVFGNPQPAGSKTSGVTKTGRRYVRDSNPNSKEWKRVVSQAAGDAMGETELLTGPLQAMFKFWRPRPAAHYGAKGVLPSAPRWPTSRPDLLKLARAAEDGMTGIVYRDDAQIVQEILTKEWGSPARVEIFISQLP